jgi:hypothetical protein
MKAEGRRQKVERREVGGKRQKEIKWKGINKDN